MLPIRPEQTFDFYIVMYAIYPRDKKELIEVGVAGDCESAGKLAKSLMISGTPSTLLRKRLRPRRLRSRRTDYIRMLDSIFVHIDVVWKCSTFCGLRSRKEG